MKAALLILGLSLALLLPARAQRSDGGQKKFVLYAQFLDETRVELDDGAVWMMDKGDCFPIFQFKEHQTKVILQMGSTNFTTAADRVRVMKESENEAALASYRKNLADFLSTRAEAWKKENNVKKGDAPKKKLELAPTP